MKISFSSATMIPVSIAGTAYSYDCNHPHSRLRTADAYNESTCASQRETALSSHRPRRTLTIEHHLGDCLWQASPEQGRKWRDNNRLDVRKERVRKRKGERKKEREEGEREGG